MSRTPPGQLFSLVAAAAVFAASASASAAGIAVARFGGAHGNPTETNAYSIYYNPAGVAGVSGYQLSLDVNWALRTATYDRPVSAIDDLDQQSPEGIEANSGEGSVNNFIYAPMLGFATDFRTGLPFGVAFGFFAPFGGQSVWDQSEPSSQFPGAVDGPNRWYVIEGTIRTLAFAVAGGYRIESARLSFGLAANLYLSEIDTIRARVSRGRDTLASEGRSWLSASSTDIGLGVGVLWEPIEHRLWIGASYQSAPGFNGEQVYEGELVNVFPPNDGEPNDIVVTSQLPDILRLGARFRINRETEQDDGTPSPLAEVRLSADYTGWSRLKSQCIIDVGPLGDADPYEFCAVNDDGSLVTSGNSVVQNLGRNWQDTLGVRLGGSFWVNDAIELQLDVGYDANAIPDESLEPALMDFRKATVGIGGRFRFAPSVAFGLLATNVFYFERDTTDLGTAETLSPPSRQPSSEGVYNQNVFVVNTNLDFSF